MSWVLEGKRIKGVYLNTHPFTGVVTLSRVKYGAMGNVEHTVKLDEPITVFGTLREVLLVDSRDVLGVL